MILQKEILDLQDGDDSSGLCEFIVKQEKFNGPFDLLLSLIDEKRLDIGEIFLNNIISDYIEYLKSLKKIDIIVSSEFLVMAAYLIETKSRLLLPAEEGVQEEAEVGSIELSLLEHMAQYKIFKEAAWQLRERKNIFQKVYSRHQLGLAQDRPGDIFLVDITVRDLVMAFQKIWDNVVEGEHEKEILDEPVTVNEKIAEILEKVKNNPAGVVFEALFLKRTRFEIIVTFLAMLELICRKMIKFIQEDNFGKITIFYIDLRSA